MINWETTDEVSVFILELLDEFSVGVIPSRSFNKSGTRGKLCLMNITMRTHIFRQGQPLATAAPAIEAGILKTSVRQVGTESPFEVPKHIKKLLDDIWINAPPDVSDEAVLAITRYSDVFAVSDLVSIQLPSIETEEARPVTQRMHRTLVVFHGEEEGHLECMLAAGVIQPSTSDWAAAPVLIGRTALCRDASIIERLKGDG